MLEIFVYQYLNTRFNLHYIISKHAEILPKQNYHRIIFCGGEHLSFGIFENMLLVEMESSKLNNYLAGTW
jgi:hypothetical protein